MPRTPGGVYYEVHGRGEPVLHLHGSQAVVSPALPVLASPLAARFRVVVLDHAGTGRSRAVGGRTSMAQYADDAAAVLDALGVARVHVVGTSFGGAVALELLCRHPRRVRRAVLCCCSPGGPGTTPPPDLAALRARSATPEAYARALLRLADTRVAAPSPDAVAARASAVADHDGMARQFAARAGHDCQARLGAVTAPCLLCHADHDGICPPDNGRVLRACLPAAEARTYAGGHFFFATRYGEFADWLGGEGQ